MEKCVTVDLIKIMLCIHPPSNVAVSPWIQYLFSVFILVCFILASWCELRTRNI